MNKIVKQLVAIFVGVMFFAGSVAAQPGQPGPDQQGPAPEGRPGMVGGCLSGPGSMDITPTAVCYLPDEEVFVVIDSIDCAVDMLAREADSMRRVGRYYTDDTYKRHDLQNILRPKSVAVVDGKIVVLASSQSDSSYVAVLNFKPNEKGEFEVLKTVGMRHSSYAFEVNRIAAELIVAGKNSVGYDIQILDIRGGLENVASKTAYHYHVPLQSERIQDSDPHGFGLAVVAMCVVFLVLISIWLIMMLFTSIIRKVTEKKSDQPATAKEPSIGAIASGADGEVYAAIAAAIYCYEQDLHDEEDTVITIQKVERTWTPWSAKFYNMNQYFSKK